MKIVSKFKDYYDWISHKVGQDPTCTYMRGNITVNFIPVKDLDLGKTYREFPRKAWDFGAHLSTYEIGDRGQLEYLVAGEYVFPLAVVEPFGSEPRAELLNEELIDRYFYYHVNPYWRETAPQTKEGMLNPQFIPELTKLVGHPTYRIRCKNDHYMVDEKTPILKEYGIPALVDAQQMWQSIYTVMTNVLRPNPDKTVPVELSNENKIQKAGFDLKTSFRNPIKLSKLK